MIGGLLKVYQKQFVLYNSGYREWADTAPQAVVALRGI